MNAIITRDLTRRFGKTLAVDRLNLKVESGSIFGLIGPNGAGKTTTLRMLAGLLEPSDGTIRINELSIIHYWQELHWLIGFMPDFFGVYDDLLVWEYLDFFARCFKLAPSQRQQVTNELLELVDLSEKRDAYVHTLSRGMRQRLCLAHALIHDPQILLLDEPASGLDPRARVEMRELLRELRAMGKTILLSSHILSELAELCDQVAIIERSQLVISGPTDTILRHATEHRRIIIHVLGESHQTTSLLEILPGVKKVIVNQKNGGPNQIEIEFSGSDSQVADLLERLINEKIRVTKFHEANTNLEEAFLRLTKGEVN
jgi:ABC-2 type transport system ATP-binding protein